MSQHAIELKRLCRYFGNNSVVDDLSLNVQSGKGHSAVGTKRSRQDDDHSNPDGTAVTDTWDGKDVGNQRSHYVNRYPQTYWLPG